MRLNNLGTLGPALLILALSLFQGACDRSEKPLQLGDLSSGEYTYIERIIILERVKAVALNDRDLGNTLLDSLTLAWDDSVESQTGKLISTDPHRSKTVHELLLRILVAENDSLVEAPLPRRISAPLPDPLAEPEDK
jgi:hypothetical protein